MQYHLSLNGIKTFSFAIWPFAVQLSRTAYSKFVLYRLIGMQRFLNTKSMNCLVKQQFVISYAL